jgi:hypothetical protein
MLIRINMLLLHIWVGAEFHFMKTAQKTNKILTTLLSVSIDNIEKIKKTLPFAGSCSFNQTEHLMAVSSAHLFKH